MTIPEKRRTRPGIGAFTTPLVIDRTSPVPIHRQIYVLYQEAIASGRLRPGQLLPSTRVLALELGVSRAPVLSAFEQLVAEGYVDATVGSGTKVRETIPTVLSRRSPLCLASTTVVPANRASRRAAALVEPDRPWLAQPGAFRASMPALDRFPSDIWSPLITRHSKGRTVGSLGYGDPMGYLPLREAIALYLGAARGVHCSPLQVMVVSGSQQGLHLAARSLLDVGDRILVEEPGYPGARAAFSSAQLEMMPVPVDREGMIVHNGVARAPDARAAYVTPSHQYPLGFAMSAARRLQLLDWAGDQGAWIIEDDYDSEFRFGARPMPALHGIDRGARTVYIGTFSKVMFPALRVGYVVIPEDIVPAFRAVRAATDIFPPTPLQAALADFLAEGHFARHLRRMRLIYERRRTWLAEALAERLGGSLEVVGIEAGMHLTALLQDGLDDVTLAVRASERGVSSIPLSSCFLGVATSSGLILGYGNADERELDRGVTVLEALLASAEQG